jgi:hypothetical protein
MSMRGPSAPLDFRFRVAEPHDRLPIARLRIAARIRVSLWRHGVETLGELEGLSAREIAAFHGMDAGAAIRVVSAVRWRCCRHLSAWPLLRETSVDNLQIPIYAARALRAAGCFTLDDVVRLDPDVIPMLADRVAPGLEQRLDQYARLAELPGQRLRAITACPDPYVLPRIDPLVLIALALAEGIVEKLVALTLGLPTTDSEMLLARWGVDGTPPPTFDALGRRFGVAGQRVRQVVVNRESELATAGMRVPVLASETTQQCFDFMLAVIQRLRLGGS